MPEKWSCKFFFTVTLRPNLYKDIAEEQYDLTAERLLNHIKEDYPCCVKTTIVAELTKNMNIHYHGIIMFDLNEVRFKNLSKYFIDSFRDNKKFGFVNISQIEDEKKVLDYVSKSIQDTALSIGKKVILIDEFEYLNGSNYDQLKLINKFGEENDIGVGGDP